MIRFQNGKKEEHERRGTDEIRLLVWESIENHTFGSSSGCDLGESAKIRMEMETKRRNLDS